MKKQLKVKVCNINEESEFAIYLCDLVVDVLLEKVRENPKEFIDKILFLEGEEKIEDSSLL